MRQDAPAANNCEAELDVHVSVFTDDIFAPWVRGDDGRKVPFMRGHVDIGTQVAAITGRDMDIPQDPDAWAYLLDHHIGGLDQAPDLAEDLFGGVPFLDKHWVSLLCQSSDSCS